METQNPISNNNNSSYASVIGSTISVICFFAPWIGCSGREFSGADIGNDLWLIFASSLVSLLAFVFFKSQKKLSKAKVYIVVSSILGICLMLYEYINFQSSKFHQAFEIKWGSIGTLLGFFVTLAGTVYLVDEMPKEIISKIGSNENIYCQQCGKKYTSEHIGEFCDECGNKL